MNFDIIAQQEHSQCDFAGIFQFSSETLAKIAAKAINDSPLVNTKGRVQLGQTGAFQVGNCVVFNSYSEEAFANIRKTVEGLEAKEADLKELWRDLWDSLKDENQPYQESRGLAIDYFMAALPGASGSTASVEYQFIVKYRGVKFTAQLKWARDDSRIMFFADPKVPSYDTKPDFSIFEYNEEFKGIFDNIVSRYTPVAPKVTPATAMFDLLEKIDFSKHLPKATEKKIRGIANLFFHSYLKEASVFGVEANHESVINWVEAWFRYKGKKYHLDFCLEHGSNTLCLYTTNKYQENVDCAYVTVGKLHEKIDSVDDTGHFPGHSTEDAKDEPKDEPRKSLEERLDKVEHIISSLQDEVKEIKKKI